MPNADLTYWATFFPPGLADEYLAALTEQTNWRQERIRLYGKSIPLPRLTAWHADAGLTYTYSGITVTPDPWSPTLLAVRSAVEAACGATFNSVLLNLYRDGRDSVSWHADDEPAFGPNPVIASVSFGAERRFHLKHKTDPHLRHRMTLAHGSLLRMAGATQHHWLHQVPKDRTTQPRLNLTFRLVR